MTSGRGPVLLSLLCLLFQEHGVGALELRTPDRTADDMSPPAMSTATPATNSAPVAAGGPPESDEEIPGTTSPATTSPAPPESDEEIPGATSPATTSPAPPESDEEIPGATSPAATSPAPPESDEEVRGTTSPAATSPAPPESDEEVPGATSPATTSPAPPESDEEIPGATSPAATSPAQQPPRRDATSPKTPAQQQPSRRSADCRGACFRPSAQILFPPPSGGSGRTPIGPISFEVAPSSFNSREEEVQETELRRASSPAAGQTTQSPHSKSGPSSMEFAWPTANQKFELYANKIHEPTEEFVSSEAMLVHQRMGLSAVGSFSDEKLGESRNHDHHSITRIRSRCGQFASMGSLLCFQVEGTFLISVPHFFNSVVVCVGMEPLLSNV